LELVFDRTKTAMRGAKWVAAFLLGLVAFVFTQEMAHRRFTALAAADSTPSATLQQLVAGQLKLLDLTYAVNESSAYWPGPGYEPFRLKTIATLERDGVLSKAFCSPEHLGTHIDAPNHFERQQPSVDQIAVQDLVAPGVVIDVSGPASTDADYRLRLEDVHAWEEAHGRIPDRAVVLLHTGWGRFWGQPVRFRNQDVRGQMHFPGYSAEAAKFLVTERHVRGIGIDTMSIDYGLSRDFAVHHVVNSHGRYALENLAQLDRLPPTGFYLMIAPMKIETGSGGPTRVLAIWL
jgi:kynurenine formamidase